MSDKDKGSKGDWRLKQIALVAYAVATAAGMFYGRAYYDHFGITLLDYASPIDLLFIALANLEEVTLAALLVPLLFLCMVAVFLSGLFVLFLLVVAVAVVLGWVALSTCALVVGSLAFAVAVVRVVALRAHLLWAALAAIRTDRRERTKRIRADADQEDVPKVAEEPLRLAAAYRQVSQDVPAWKAIDPQTYIGIAHDPILASIDPVTQWGKKHLFAILRGVHEASEGIRAAYLSSNATESGERRWRFKSWQSLDLAPKFVLVAVALIFLVYLLYTASRLGTFNAEELLSEAQGLESTAKSSRSLWDVLVPLPTLRDVPNDDVPSFPDVFVVPTENLASLDFSNCLSQTDKARRLFSRANFRQDASGDSWHGTPECLLRLGSVGRWQFLADTRNSGERKQRVMAHTHPARPRDPVTLVVNNSNLSIPPPREIPGNGSGEQEDQPLVVVFDGREGVISTPACNLELAALIGPFPTGRAVLESNIESSDQTYECTAPDGKERELEHIKSIGHGGLPTWQDRLIENPSEMVVLVGRADVRPISNDEFTSNMKLATERANWVRKKLGRNEESLSILNITGGPADLQPNDNPCSRVVEVHTCSADQAASEDA